MIGRYQNFLNSEVKTRSNYSSAIKKKNIFSWSSPNHEFVKCKMSVKTSWRYVTKI